MLLTVNNMTFPLKNLPEDVRKIVREEQLRLELEEGIKLKREEVYYRIVREWSKTYNTRKLTVGK